MTPEVWESFRKQAGERSHMDRIAPAGSPARFAYLALGLCGESAEAIAAIAHENYVRADAVSELGDVAWYLAMVENESGVSVDWPSELEGPRSLQNLTGQLTEAACWVAECAKRPLCGREMKQGALKIALDAVAYSLAQITVNIGVTMPEILAANIAKNHARFGTEGYTVERQRVLDAANQKEGAK